MKTLLPLAILLVVSLTAPLQAGGFGGPPPFTNGSPLANGTDGQWSANFRGINTVGYARFQMSGGVQTSDAAQNIYAIFIDGFSVTGATSASIAQDEIACVLVGATANSPSASGPGEFTAKIKMNTPGMTFKGKGNVDLYFLDPATGFLVFEISRGFNVKGARVSQSP